MLRDTEELRAFERWYAREYIAPLTYQQALERFTALWVLARSLNPDFPGDWERDVAADIEMARVLNRVRAAP